MRMGEYIMTKSEATRDAYGEELLALGQVNERIVVLDADLSGSTRTSRFARAFPERFFNVGIAEQNMIGIAAGLATAGKIPFASSFAVFALGRAYDQLRTSVAYNNLNVKIAATHAGLSVGADGASHQALEDIALARALPNIRVVVPADGVETRAAVRTAAAVEGPVYLRLGRPKVPVLFGPEHEFAFGRGQKLREGSRAAIVSCGVMTYRALRAAEALAREGIEVTVVNMPSLKPLDEELLLEVARSCGAVVTVEEHSIIGGLGSAVAEFLSEEHPVPLRRVGVRDAFGRSGTPEDLFQAYGLTEADICRAVRELL